VVGGFIIIVKVIWMKKMEKQIYAKKRGKKERSEKVLVIAYPWSYVYYFL